LKIANEKGELFWFNNAEEQRRAMPPYLTLEDAARSHDLNRCAWDNKIYF